MTDILLQLTLLTILVGLAGYRLTRLIVNDDIMSTWRKRHGIGVKGYLCADVWTPLWPECDDEPVEEFSSELPYRDAVEKASAHHWPLSWLALLMDARFWERAFSCPYCGSVWICGLLAGVAVLVMAVATGSPVWLAGWLVIAPASSGIASWAL